MTAKQISGVYAPDGSVYITPTDGNGDLVSLEGSGTVTSVSVTTAHGVSGTVATAASTPAITLTLGAITPTTVVASGKVSAPDLNLNVYTVTTLPGTPAAGDVALSFRCY